MTAINHRAAGSGVLSNPACVGTLLHFYGETTMSYLYLVYTLDVTHVIDIPGLPAFHSARNRIWSEAWEQDLPMPRTLTRTWICRDTRTCDDNDSVGSVSQADWSDTGGGVHIYQQLWSLLLLLEPGGIQLEKGVQGKAIHVSVGDVWLVQGGLGWRRVLNVGLLYMYQWEMYGWYRTLCKHALQ